MHDREHAEPETQLSAIRQQPAGSVFKPGQWSQRQRQVKEDQARIPDRPLEPHFSHPIRPAEPEQIDQPYPGDADDGVSENDSCHRR